MCGEGKANNCACAPGLPVYLNVIDWSHETTIATPRVYEIKSLGYASKTHDLALYY